VINFCRSRQSHPPQILLFAILGLLLSTVSVDAAAVEGDPGVLLVAAPGHGGEAFRETVLLLKRHARGGTVGVVLNRPTETRVGELIPGSREPDGLAAHVYAGGPAEPDQVVFLVRTRSLRPSNALQVFDKVFLAYDPQLLIDILRHPVPLLGLRVFRGHARWGQGELEAEIARGEWYLVEADADGVFEDDPGTLWQRLVQQVEERGVTAPDPGRSTRAVPANARS
jgi:putative transcriptional regulator